MRHRPDYVARGARRAEWPVAERTAAIDRELATGRRHDRAVGRALIAFTALVIIGTVGGLAAYALFGPEQVVWVWP